MEKSEEKVDGNVAHKALGECLNLAQVSQRFGTGNKEILVLDKVDLRIEEGSFVSLFGSSGSGKSTLLLASGAMRKPTDGEVSVLGRSVGDLSAKQRSVFRAKNIGYVFQTLELIPYLSLIDNVCIAGSQFREHGIELLEQFGLTDRINHKPQSLSQGERQRGAIARALVHRPKFLIADEPTGNLDRENSSMIFDRLKEYCELGNSVLIATHDELAMKLSDEIYRLENSKIKSLES